MMVIRSLLDMTCLFLKTDAGVAAAVRAVLRNAVTAIVILQGLLLSSALCAGPTEDEALIEATKAGNLKRVQDALANGANVDAKGAGSKTALMFATLWRRLDVAEELLARGANLNAETSGCTPLCMAVLRNFPQFIALLMAKGGRMGSERNPTVAGLFLFGFMDPADFKSMQAAGKREPAIAKDPSKPDFTGIWILDRKRSTYQNSPKLPATTLTISHAGKYLVAVWNGSVDGWIIGDGQTVKQSGRGSVTRTSVKWQGASLLFEGSIEEKNRVTPTESTWRLEDGGKELKITREIKAPKHGSAELLFVPQERRTSE